jgi:hypothetical protein
MAELTVEIIGWIGMILVLLGYFLITYGKVNRKSKSYHSINLFGASLLGINTAVNGAYPSSFLNIVWIFIAAYGLIKGLKK